MKRRLEWGTPRRRQGRDERRVWPCSLAGRSAKVSLSQIFEYVGAMFYIRRDRLPLFDPRAILSDAFSAAARITSSATST
jgi:hypothetical protein